MCRFNTPVSVDGELNDVRAPRSEKLKFWVEFALRRTTDLSKIQNQISFIGYTQPAKFDPMQQQTYALTYPGDRCRLADDDDNILMHFMLSVFYWP